jgi:hypothetical protein
MLVEINPVTIVREAWASAKAKRLKLAFETRRDALLARAKMNIFQWNTRVVRSTDDSFRVQVGGAYENHWGDCVSIGVRHPKDPPGEWRVAHFSPARARLIAEHLTMMADHLEKEEPTSMDIDKEETQ